MIKLTPFKPALLSICAAATFAFNGQAALIFDNADAPLSTTFRGPDNVGVAAYLLIGANNVSINQIAINAAPGLNGQLKFVIFSDVAPPGSNVGPLLFSDTVNVTASASLGYIFSDPISFLLLANHYYDIGAVFSGNAINYSYDLTPNTQNGITSIISNQNVENFANPILVGHAAADINIKLFGPAVGAPDGGTTLFLLGAALSGIALLRKKLSV
jgi:hypothetical protein